MADIERESLDAHVSICEIRYQSLEYRLSSVEEKLDNITHEMHRMKHTISKNLIGATASIIVAIIGTLAVLAQMNII